MRSTPIFKILSAAVLAAVVVLLGVQTYRYFHRPLSVSAAYTSQVSDSISVTGWVVRQETALPEVSGTLLRQVQEGEKVHAGQTVAVSYASKSALETVKELEDAELKLQQHAEKISDLKGVQMKIEWGSQIRSYVFMPYTLAKDTRTGYEMGNIQAVMDGDIDGFINAYLTAAANGEIKK